MKLKNFKIIPVLLLAGIMMSCARNPTGALIPGHYTLIFDSCGASIAATPSFLTVTAGEDLQYMPEAPVKTGYSFAGWYTEKFGFGMEFTAASEIAADILLYAKWVNDPAQGIRYINDVFSTISLTENVVYGTALWLQSPYTDESNTAEGNLLMDIYAPAGDAETARPAIVFVHAGGFIAGSKDDSDMAAFCTAFAKKGYVTAAISYRLGMYLAGAKSATRAGYRAMQDARTAVRFLKKNAAVYGLDPLNVCMAGSSAGAFIALHSVYMNEADEKPEEAGAYTYYSVADGFDINAPDLGGFDEGANTEFGGAPAAIMAMSGAVKDTALIKAGDNTPVFLMHGTADDSVPFGYGHPFGYPVFPATYGSSLIAEKLALLGIEASGTYFVEGAGHIFYKDQSDGTKGGSEYWSPVIENTVEFFYNSLNL